MSLTSSPGRTPGSSPEAFLRPAPASGLVLLGELAGSGYRTPPALVRRPDGQTIQLTTLLYLVLQAVDGERSCAEIAAVVSAAYGRRVGEDDVRLLAETKLRPLLRRALPWTAVADLIRS